MNIIIDGPEKSGKTTTITLLARELKKYFPIVDVLKWTGRAKPDDSEYSADLQKYAASPVAVAIWDRGWPSEYVYGKLLQQDRRMAKDPWLGAWLHDRAVSANGLRIMMLGSSAADLANLRDGSDLDVDPESEVQLYKEYAERFGWMILQGYPYTTYGLQQNLEIILTHLSIQQEFKPLPPSWSGPQDAEVVFVGNENREKYLSGGWLPFTSNSASWFGRTFGDSALRYAWINARTCNPAYLRRRKLIVACGNIASLWVRNYIADKENRDQKILYIPHPSYLFKFKSAKSTNSALEEVYRILYIRR